MTLLILDDDPDVALAARLALRRLGQVAVRHAPAELPAALDTLSPQVLLLDMNFTPGASDGAAGLALLREVMARPRPPAVIVMTAYAEVELAVQALKAGAVDFITKPWANERLLASVQAALARQAPVPGDADGLLGESAAMQSLRAQIAQVGASEASVLILGENGVGKSRLVDEVIARLRDRGPAPAEFAPGHAQAAGALRPAPARLACRRRSHAGRHTRRACRAWHQRVVIGQSVHRRRRHIGRGAILFRFRLLSHRGFLARARSQHELSVIVVHLRPAIRVLR